MLFLDLWWKTSRVQREMWRTKAKRKKYSKACVNQSIVHTQEVYVHSFMYKKWHPLITAGASSSSSHCHDGTTLQHFSAPLAFLRYCSVGVLLPFLYGNPPKQFVQIVSLKMSLRFYSTSIVFLKYYTRTVRWIHLFTYSCRLPRQRWTRWDCLSAQEYLRLTPHWHFLGFQTGSTLIPSLSSSGILFICLFLLLSLPLSLSLFPPFNPLFIFF